MSERKFFDTPLGELVIIDAADIPPSLRTDWRAVFDNIPTGKAAVITREMLPNFKLAKSALKRWRRRGYYPTYEIVQSGDKLYVVHRAEE